MHDVAYGGGGIITLYSQQIQNKNWCSAVQCIKSETAKICVFSRRLKIPSVWRSDSGLWRANCLSQYVLSPPGNLLAGSCCNIPQWTLRIMVPLCFILWTNKWRERKAGKNFQFVNFADWIECCSTQWRRSVVKSGVRVSQVKPSNCFRLHPTSTISKHSTIPVPGSL